MKRKFMIVCVAGQSNAVGYDESLVPADYCAQFDMERIFQLGLYGEDNLRVIPLGACAQSYQDMRPFGHPSNPGVGTKGIHLPLAQQLLAHIPADYSVLMISCAYGGSGFTVGTHGPYDEERLAPQPGVWRWGAESNYYRGMKERIAYALNLNPENRFLGVVWCQGEHDSGDAAGQMAGFEAMTADFFAHFAAHYPGRVYQGDWNRDIWYNYETVSYWYTQGECAQIWANYRAWNPKTYVEIPRETNSNEVNGTGITARIRGAHFGNDAFLKVVAPRVADVMGARLKKAGKSSMAEGYWAREEELAEIVEFLDYVFSKAHRPHDFASLLPKVYGENGDGAAHHFVVRENGKLMAAIFCYPMTMRMGDEALTVLGIGSVSTHPVARGKGYMKLLMEAADMRAQEIQADFAVLSGLRQRYEHFGYMYGGYQMNAKLTAHNVAHALQEEDTGDWRVETMGLAHVQAAMTLQQKQRCFFERRKEAYLDSLRSWNNEPFVLMKHGEPVGFGALRRNAESTHVAELLLENEADFAGAMKALFMKHGTLTICAAPWETERAAWLSAYCQDFSITKNHAYKIYRPERVKNACAGMGMGQGAFEFLGFSLPLPLYIAPPDCV